MKGRRKRKGCLKVQDMWKIQRSKFIFFSYLSSSYGTNHKEVEVSMLTY